jgi:hypothetical protein
MIIKLRQQPFMAISEMAAPARLMNELVQTGEEFLDEKFSNIFSNSNFTFDI